MPLLSVGAKIHLWVITRAHVWALQPEGLLLEASKLPPYKLHQVTLLITFIWVI